MNKYYEKDIQVYVNGADYSLDVKGFVRKSIDGIRTLYINSIVAHINDLDNIWQAYDGNTDFLCASLQKRFDERIVSGQLNVDEVCV